MVIISRNLQDTYKNFSYKYFKKYFGSNDKFLEDMKLSLLLKNVFQMRGVYLGNWKQGYVN